MPDHNFFGVDDFGVGSPNTPSNIFVKLIGHAAPYIIGLKTGYFLHCAFHSALGVIIFIDVVGRLDKAGHAATIKPSTLKFIGHHATAFGLFLQGVS